MFLVIQGGPKNWHSFLYDLTLSNINRFTKLFYCQNQKKICNNTMAKNLTTPSVSLHYLQFLHQIFNVSTLLLDNALRLAMPVA